MNKKEELIYSDVEKEILILGAAWLLIDDMVNYAIFTKPKKENFTELRFSDNNASRVFNILLNDFLSMPNSDIIKEPSHNEERPTDQTMLYGLEKICQAPQLGGPVVHLQKAVNNFREWLEFEAAIKDFNFSYIGKELDFSCKRMVFLKISGNIAKHNFSRLSDNVKKIKKAFERNGEVIDAGDGLRILEDFYNKIHGDVLHYHATALAGFLNEIRWGVYCYLKPAYARSYADISDPKIKKWRFKAPDECRDEFALQIHWDLMSKVHRGPFFPRFKTHEIFKLRY